jgi:hypothetical protein
MLVMFVCVHPLLLTLLLHLTLGVEFPSDLMDTGEHILQGAVVRGSLALKPHSRRRAVFLSVSGRQKKIVRTLALGSAVRRNAAKTDALRKQVVG